MSEFIPGYSNRDLYDWKEECLELGFLVHPEFYEVEDALLRRIWNGVGAADGGVVNHVIPNRLWFLDCSLASLPHDFAFYMGGSRRDFHIANLHYLFNINQIIREYSGNGFMVGARYVLSNKFYLAVESPAGYSAFCAGGRVKMEVRDEDCGCGSVC